MGDAPPSISWYLKIVPETHYVRTSNVKLREKVGRILPFADRIPRPCKGRVAPSTGSKMFAGDESVDQIIDENELPSGAIRCGSRIWSDSMADLPSALNPVTIRRSWPCNLFALNMGSLIWSFGGIDKGPAERPFGYKWGADPILRHFTRILQLPVHLWQRSIYYLLPQNREHAVNAPEQSNRPAWLHAHATIHYKTDMYIKEDSNMPYRINSKHNRQKVQILANNLIHQRDLYWKWGCRGKQSVFPVYIWPFRSMYPIFQTWSKCANLQGNFGCQQLQGIEAAYTFQRFLKWSYPRRNGEK